MMAAFFLGCGAALACVALAPNLTTLAVALFVLGVFSAIYHPVGMAMLIEVSQARGRTLAFNGVCGNLGAALAAAITAGLAYWLGWQGAFAVPAVLCVATGIAYMLMVEDDRHAVAARNKAAEVPLTARAAVFIFALYIVISLASGLTFNTSLIAVPKIFDEKLGASVDLRVIGGLATGVFLCGAIAQLAVGRLVERLPAHLLFGGVVTLQFIGIFWAAHTTGTALIVALALTMAAIYAQVTVGDIVIARYTADAWRGRIYAVRYFLTFVSSGIAVSLIALLHGRGGFDLVLTVLAATAGVLLVTVLGFVLIVSGVESRRSAAQPAE